MTARLEDGTPNDPMVDLLEDWPLVCTHKGTHLYTPLPSSGSGRQKNFKQDKRHKFAEKSVIKLVYSFFARTLSQRIFIHSSCCALVSEPHELPTRTL